MNAPRKPYDQMTETEILTLLAKPQRIVSYPVLIRIMSGHHGRSEAVQIAGVKHDANCIKHVVSPSEDLKLLAVSLYGYVISDIKNPSMTLQRAAVKFDPGVISRIFKPAAEIKRYALSMSWQAIHSINNPSREDCLTALMHHPFLNAEDMGLFHSSGLKKIWTNAPKFLNRATPGLGDAYLVCKAMGLDNAEASSMLFEHQQRTQKRPDTVAPPSAATP